MASIKPILVLMTAYQQKETLTNRMECLANLRDISFFVAKPSRDYRHSPTITKTVRVSREYLSVTSISQDMTPFALFAT